MIMNKIRIRLAITLETDYDYQAVAKLLEPRSDFSVEAVVGWIMSQSKAELKEWIVEDLNDNHSDSV